MPPAALISSTAISMEALPAWPHSVPLPVRGVMAPILTVRPDNWPASAAIIGTATNAATATAIAVIYFTRIFT